MLLHKTSEIGSSNLIFLDVLSSGSGLQLHKLFTVSFILTPVLSDKVTLLL